MEKPQVTVQTFRHGRMQRIGQLIADVAILFCIGFASLGLLFLIGGESGNGVAPYYREVARNCFSITQLLKYTLITGAYAASLEIGLRLIQHVSQKRWGGLAGVSIAAVAYGLTHLKFHLSGAIYAGIMGIGTAWFFYRTQRWKSLVVWHVCWEIVAIGFVVFSSMFLDSGCRHIAIHEYKRSQIEAGKLFFVEQWGWADQGHCPFEHIASLRRKLRQNRGKTVQFTRTSVTTDAWHGAKFIDYSYRIDPPLMATESECHAAAAFVIWDAARRHEIQQSQLNILSGARMSAFTIDDLPSALLTAYMMQPDDHHSVTLPIQSLSRDLSRWHDEGLELIPITIMELDDFQPRNEAVARDLRRLVDRMKQTASWSQFVKPEVP